MDINNVKATRETLNIKEVELSKSENKKEVKNDKTKGCIKLADYMAF